MIIRKMQKSDVEGKGYVHYHSWNETYTGLINQSFLDKRSLTRCIDIATHYPDNTYVAIMDNMVVGFSSHMKARDAELEDAGEVSAIYVLKDYQGLGIGKTLMDVAMEQLKDKSLVIVYVLSTNTKAIDFYLSYGFVRDGTEKRVQVDVDTVLHEIRMSYQIRRT